MNGFDVEADETAFPEVRELSKAQRRVLGVLIEKAYTTPEYYPMTLKAATGGCNQKSNRAPITNYSEDAVLQTLDELRELGLVAVVHTETGRTERYRHYVRKRFPFTEPQLAIITELLLRGKQQLGELRSRASRMVPIESLGDLRNELTDLQEKGYIQASGPLERRGIEVDHSFYPASENMKLAAAATDSAPSAERSVSGPVSGNSSPTVDSGVSIAADRQLHQEVATLRQENVQMQAEIESLRQVVDDIKDDLDELRRSLGA